MSAYQRKGMSTWLLVLGLGLRLDVSVDVTFDVKVVVRVSKLVVSD